MNTPELSIILPTCNRAELLMKAIFAIDRATHTEYELIVVDGASGDSTQDVLQLCRSFMGSRLRVIREEQREGFVRACNKGFRAARGRYMTWLNDDARPLDASLDHAIAQLDAESSDCAFVAMFHPWHATKNVAYQREIEGQAFHLCHVRATLYANFPLGLRRTFEQLDYFDERYFVCAADPDLSLKAWNAGLRVVPAHDSYIDHEEVQDARRAADSPRGAADNAALFAKWDLPARSPVNDFDPRRPCTLRGLRSTSLAA